MLVGRTRVRDRDPAHHGCVALLDHAYLPDHGAHRRVGTLVGFLLGLVICFNVESTGSPVVAYSTRTVLA